MKMKGKVFFIALGLAVLMSSLWAQPKSQPRLKAQYYNSASSTLILPECIWSPAAGGGTWVTEVQIVALTDCSSVNAIFLYGGGNYRGPFTLITSFASWTTFVTSNILQTLDSLDPDDTFSYYGRVGAVILMTGDPIAELIFALARTNNGPYGKTFNALSDVDANFCSYEPFRPMALGGLVSNSQFRTSMGGVNFGSQPLEVYFEIYDATGTLIGTPFTETFVGYDFKAFNPFAKAGIPYPTYSYDIAYIAIFPVSGTGRVAFFGATANNSTNDPAALLPFQVR
jgi:hypothetical protein